MAERLAARRGFGASLACALGLVALPQSPARAGNVWDGGGGNDNWTTGANWNADNQPPANNGSIDVVMAGTTRLNPNVNVAYDIRGLIFNFDAGPFVLGGQELTIGAGGILQGDAQLQAINNAIDLDVSQTWDAFSGGLHFGGGTVTLGGGVPRTLSVTGAFGTSINGPIQGFGTLAKFGTSFLTLGGTAANTFVGGAVVNSGALILQKPASVVAIPTNLTIGDGVGTDVVRLDQNNQIADTSIVTINSAGLLDLNVKSETIAQLIINGGSVATSGETFTVSGSLAVNSGTYIANGQTLSAGSMQVGFNGGSGRFVQAAGFFSNVSCFGDLRVGDGVSGSGRYELHSGTVALLGTLIVGGAGTGHYVQNGGLSFLQGVTNDGSIQIVGGIFTANALLGTGTFSVTGSGTVNVTTIRQGGLNITGAGARVRVGPNGTTLALCRVGAINLGTPGLGGTLDLTDNDLIVDYTAASPLPLVREYIASGYNGGAWDGKGIVASSGAASTFGLGYVEASDIYTTFPAHYLGHTVDSTTVLVVFRRFGDANIDFIVNLDDFNRLAANFGSTGVTWAQGDFTYDGNVNLDDFNRLAANFGMSAAPSGVTPGDWSALARAVPEPSVVTALCGIFLCARRVRTVHRARTDDARTFPS